MNRYPIFFYRADATFGGICNAAVLPNDAMFGGICNATVLPNDATFGGICNAAVLPNDAMFGGICNAAVFHNRILNSTKKKSGNTIAAQHIQLPLNIYNCPEKKN